MIDPLTFAFMVVAGSLIVMAVAATLREAWWANARRDLRKQLSISIACQQQLRSDWAELYLRLEKMKAEKKELVKCLSGNADFWHNRYMQKTLELRRLWEGISCE